MLLELERTKVVEYGKELIKRKITVGTFGNISIYNPEKKLMAISPSGLDYFSTQVADVVVVDLEGNVVDGDLKPSSEVDLHRVFYQKRPDVRAVVHTHSEFATVLSCLRKPIPALHYIVGYSGKEVPCIPYYAFGTEALAEAALKGMGDNHAVIMGNHGLLAVGPSIEYTMDVAEQCEFAAMLYYRCLAVGEPVLLTEDEMQEVIGKFDHYRKR